MKISAFSHHDIAATGADTAGHVGRGLFAPLKRAINAVRAASAGRTMRAELAQLDDNILRDIGIADDEIARVRAQVPFTPRAWRT